MNARILDVSRKTPCSDAMQDMLFHDLPGFVCFIPSVIVGECMTVMYGNAVTMRHRSTTVTDCRIDYATGIYSIETSEATYELLDLEYSTAKRRKRIASTLYMESRILHNPLRAERDPDGHLFSDGRYKTKIFASDLPEHFVYGYLYKRHGFISAAGVKHLLYVPNYLFNHRNKYDSLYISYAAPIIAASGDHGMGLFDGCKHIIGGSLIIDSIDAAEKFSGFDVSDIRSEIKRKSDWFDGKYGSNGVSCGSEGNLRKGVKQHDAG